MQSNPGPCMHADGKRVRKWNVQSQAYGEAWAAGDIIGSCLDLDRGELTFYRNGVSMGVAFRTVRTMQPHLAYFPTVSLSYTERCELNYGGRPFVYPVKGYQPLQLSPSEHQLGLGTYLLGCMERLARAAATSGTGPGAWGAEQGPWQEDPEDGGARRDEPQSSRAASGPAAGMAVAGLGGPNWQLRWEDAALLASALCGHLLPLMVPAGSGQPSEYFISGPLLESFMRLHGSGEPHDPAALRSAVRLLQVIQEGERGDGCVCLVGDDRKQSK
jgi:hypothetical protein